MNNIHQLSSLATACHNVEEAFQNKAFSECLAALGPVLPQVLHAKISDYETPIRSWFVHDQWIKIKRVIYGLVAERTLLSATNDRLFDILIRAFREIYDKGSGLYHRRWDHQMDQALIDLSIKSHRETELLDLLSALRQKHSSPSSRDANLFLLTFKLLHKCGRIVEANTFLDFALNMLSSSQDYFFEQRVARYYVGFGEFRRACELLRGVVDRLLQKHEGEEVPRFAIDEVICVRGFLDLVELLDDKAFAHRYADLIDLAKHHQF